MHEKLIKQLRNTEHCGGCPYDEDCNEFDSCLMDLLAADAIEDMSKRIAKLEKELQDIKEKNKYLQITKCASREQREEFLKRKEPYVRIAWERYVKQLNER